MHTSIARLVRGVCLCCTAGLVDAALSPEARADGGSAAGTSFTTGFEPGEGFLTGPIDGQVGWMAALPSHVEPHVDDAGPATGLQHLRLSRDPSLASGVLLQAISPQLGSFTGTSGTMSVQARITGGRDYQLVLDNVTEGLPVTTVRFRRTGEIEVLDADGGGGSVFVDTGATWTNGVYANLTVSLDVLAASFTVSYDGAAIYTNVGPGLPFGTAIQRVIFQAGNGIVDVSADLDDLIIVNDPAPTGACCNADGAGGCAVLTADECAATGFTSTYLGNDTPCLDCPSGACCNFDGANGCMVLTPEECSDIPSAIYGGDGSLCDACPTVPASCGAPEAGACDRANGTPGCDEFECCVVTCDALPICCDVAWDLQCAALACELCEQPPADCGVCTTGDCFASGGNGSPYCNDLCNGVECADCCQSVCAVDPFCCDSAWDATCVDEAGNICGCDPQEVPANDDCVDALPLELGATPVSTDCATPGGPDHAECGDGFLSGLGLDTWYSYTATFDGPLQVAPLPGAEWITQLAVYTGCDCGALEDPPTACAEPNGGVTLPVLEGECYLIRLGGTFAAPSGAGELVLTATPAVCVDGIGDCNSAHGGPGCDDLSCCATTCLVNPACCDTAWDQACADYADLHCAPVPCELDTSAADFIEPEACGNDQNSGCSTVPPAFNLIPLVSQVHGTSFADGGQRDRDAYRLIVFEAIDENGDGLVTIELGFRAEMPLTAELLRDELPVCNGGLIPFGEPLFSQSCVPAGPLTVDVPVPSDMVIQVTPSDADGTAIFDGYPCVGAGPTVTNSYLLDAAVSDNNLPCPWDCANGDGQVDTIDFLALLSEWGQVGTPCDPGGDGVDTVDFLELLGAWGPCP